jgi:hypothetical protein
MRIAGCCVIVALVMLSACKREPSFDERYAGAQKVIRDKARELDRDMTSRASEAATSAPQTQASGAAR